MKIYIASDHRGQALVKDLIDFLDKKDLFFNDNVFIQGPIRHTVDYPDRVPFVIHGVRAGGKGVLICGTGLGMSITANRFKGIHAALCHTPDQARMARLHNNANILVLAGTLDANVAKDCLDVFLHTSFEGERHERRIDKIEHISSID